MAKYWLPEGMPYFWILEGTLKCRLFFSWLLFPVLPSCSLLSPTFPYCLPSAFALHMSICRSPHISLKTTTKITTLSKTKEKRGKKKREVHGFYCSKSLEPRTAVYWQELRYTDKMWPLSFWQEFIIKWVSFSDELILGLPWFHFPICDVSAMCLSVVYSALCA